MNNQQIAPCITTFNKLLKFDSLKSNTDSIISLEEQNNVPFEIKRVYFIYNTDPNLPRGFHAMKESLQVLVCLKGSCDVILDDGEKKSTYHLNALNQGLFIDKLVWHVMDNITEDCVLMVLSNDIYNEEDNVRNYKTFMEMKRLV